MTLPVALRFVLLIGVVALAALLFGTNAYQSPVWVGPYLSAAANFSVPGEMQVDLEEVRAFVELTDEQRQSYRFRESTNLTTYKYNDIGFLYFIVAARKLFPLLGDQAALEALQISVHAVLSAIILLRLKGAAQRGFFLVLYALNPLIIYFVTFPYVYFWQVIPGFVFLLLDPDRHAIREVDSVGKALVFWLLAVVVGLAVLTRPTTVAVALVLLIASVKLIRPRWVPVLAACTVLMGLAVAYQPTTRNFWFTAYVGLGGYANSCGVSQLSDHEGYALFERRTGVPLNASVGGNLYEASVAEQARELLKQEYLACINSDPWRVAMNAVLNTLQAFSVGYLHGASPIVKYTVALSGLLFGFALLWSGQWWMFLAAGFAVGTFSLYYPPIPAYIYGSYILLVFGGIRFLERIGVTSHIDELLGRYWSIWATSR